MHDVFRFSWLTSIWDSLIFNFSLAGCVIILNIIVLFYKPAGRSLWISASIVIGLTALWVLKSPSLMNYIRIPEENYKSFIEQSIPLRFIFGLMINLASLGISWFWYGIEDQRAQAKHLQDIEGLAKEAELISLRLKLQPHFLFNSLNSISALIVSKPEQARTMIHQLSDFLRSTLRQDENKKIPITEELSQLELYLSIEKVRFGHRLNTIIQNSANEHMLVPAMILQPIVENAIKFGLYDTVDEVDIIIDVKEQNGELHIIVSNPFDPVTRSRGTRGTGFGLSSITRRLYLIYTRNDLLITKEENNYFFTEIIIPQ
jgi:two-component system, LytTR family, sensor kinase